MTTRLLRDLDRKAAILGVLCSLVLLVIGVRITNGIGIALALFLGSFIYLMLLKKKNGNIAGRLASFSLGRSKLLLMHVLVTSSLFLVLVISLSCFQYSRPLWYFVFVSIASAVVAIEILTLKENKFGLYSANIALQLVLLFAGIRWSVMFEFPGLPLYDPLGHFWLTDFILRTGHIISVQNLASATIPELGYAESYSSFPFTHVIVAIFCQVTALPYKLGLTLSVGFFEIISPFYVFLISRRIFKDLRASFLTTLLIGVNTYQILHGISMIPQSLGLCFFALAIYLILGRKMEIPSYIALLIVLFSITLSHTVSAFVLIVGIGAIFMSNTIFRIFKKHKLNKIIFGRITLITLLLSVVLVFSYWILFSTFFDSRVLSFVQNIRTNSGSMFPSVRSYAHYEIDQIGIYIVYILALIGFFVWLKKKKRLLPIAVMFTSFILILITYGSLTLGLNSILPTRWYAFDFFFVAILSSEGLFTLLRHMDRRKRLSLVFAFLLLFALTFTLVTNSDANTDNPLFLKNQVVETAYTASEMQGAFSVSTFYNGTIYVDALFEDAFSWSLQRNVQIINFITFELPQNAVVIERNYIYEHPTLEWDDGPYSVIKPSFAGELQGADLFYSNGEVRAYFNQSNK
jgi:hypothetical protein